MKRGEWFDLASAFGRQPEVWLSAIELDSATSPLAEVAAVIGNPRAARGGTETTNEV